MPEDEFLFVSRDGVVHSCFGTQVVFPVSRESWDQPQHGLNWDSERICPEFPLTRSHENNKTKYVSAKHGAGSKNTHGDRDTRASTYTDSPPVLRKGRSIIT